MLGFKSLAQKLRDGNGQEAPATVVEFHKGRSINWTSHGVDGQQGVTLQQGTVSKDRYRLRVDPPGEPSFEVEVKIPEDKLFGLYAVGVGSTMIVLFDPDDHAKVAVDIEATKRHIKTQLTSRKQMVQIGGIQVTAADFGQREFRADRSAPDTIAQLKELADLHERGALTDEEFKTQKAKLLNE